MSDELMPFTFPESGTSSIIKVIGVGGGGGNAVNHMYREGIHDVTFVVCNTDNQALEESPVPQKIQLGSEGLGAGNRPERARAAAEESLEDVKEMLNGYIKTKELEDIDHYIVPASLHDDQGIMGALELGRRAFEEKNS